MSKHICPKCGYKFEDSGYSEYISIENYSWSYFNVADGSSYAICDNCHEKFTEGYTGKGLLKCRYYLVPIKQQYICSECAKKLCILGD